MLALTGPDNFSVRNDDDTTAGEQTLNSRLLATLPADGRYTISVTSYGRGTTGDYALATSLNRSGIETKTHHTPLRRFGGVTGPNQRRLDGRNRPGGGSGWQAPRHRSN